MTATIWSKFFWPDWANDPALRLCSLAAQGLWMRMLCIAAEANPTGYLLVNGNALDETGLAKLAGAEVARVAELLAELERNGVFSRDRNRRIYSRRMVRDTRKRAVAKTNGKKGGNPSLSNADTNRRSDNQEVMPPLIPAVKPQEPRAKSQEPAQQAARPGETDWPEGNGVLLTAALDALGVGGAGAENAILRSSNLTQVGPLLELKRAAYSWNRHVKPCFEEYVRRRGRGRPPGNWRYFVEMVVEYAQRIDSMPQAPAKREEPWAGRLAAWRKDGSWGAWGPPPGEAGCRVPAEHLTEHGKAA